MRAAPSVWVARILFTAAFGALIITIWSTERLEWSLTTFVLALAGAALHGSSSLPKK